MYLPHYFRAHIYSVNILQCARQFNFNVDSMRACYQSQQGDQLLRAAGDTTTSLMYNLFFVPTIIFDESYDYQAQETALTDIRRAVCSKLDTTPDFCKVY